MTTGGTFVLSRDELRHFRADPALGEDSYMDARSLHPAGRSATASALLHDDTIEAGSPVALGPACCCPANPVVRVIMPATAARPHRTELLLCGHHYRVSRQALAAANATIAEIPRPEGSAPDALLPGLPGAPVPVVPSQPGRLTGPAGD
jgi:hypothetical protein